jgi:hypothetical protein
MDDLNKSIIISLIFLLAFFCANKYIFDSNGRTNQYIFNTDYVFHFNKSAGFSALPDLTHSQESYENYPYFTSLLFKPFAFSELSFYLFFLFLIAFVIPLLLFLINKNLAIIVFYFMIMSLFFELEGMTLIPETIMVILLLLFVLIKNIYFRLFLLPFSIIVHSFGFWLILFALIFSLLFKHKNKILLACSPILKYKPEILKTNFAPTSMGFNITTIINFFVRGFPLPFFLVSIKQLFNQKNYFYLSMIFIGFAGAFINTRTTHISQIFLLFGFTDFYSKSNKKMKVLIIFLALIVFVVELWQWWRIKVSGFGVDC